MWEKNPVYWCSGEEKLRPICSVALLNHPNWEEGVAILTSSKKHIYLFVFAYFIQMCACSPEGQLYPGLHREKCDQQVEGGESASLICSHETPPAVLLPGDVGLGPEEGREDDQKAGAPPLWGQAERAGAL